MYPCSGIGDGADCDGGLNNAECGYDEGDCDEFNAKYPDCLTYLPSEMGDGMCNGDLNNAECGYDEAGDCDEFNMKYPNYDVFFPFLIGHGYCDDDLDVRHFGKNYYNTLECK